ncbi:MULTISPECIES: hypothetical protein [unclassified Ensifer]|uniref:hypothetical protein n=1 Tax=unclassified Ensifer TaxID=2633371 RepID=UPI00070A37A3|nr:MULTISPECIES: hypothetical protein [unclassified Ensifer]KQW41097.1 hypothetical protein ASD02_36175 [Ensifer sp. Root1252]KRC62222.1 hypothetical protein ASE32_36270 [Ensifer sp. Root231]KRC91122.1 hypothetical protein ASE47_36240 [Ensifer sp. Root258]
MQPVNLMEMVRTWALATLPYDRNNNVISAEVHGMNVRALLRAYHNWKTRFVEARPRNLHLSQSFNDNPIAASRKDDLDSLLDKIANGEDITPHLSKRIKTVGEPSAKKIGHRKDLDLLLLEWEIHHLHISKDLEPSGEFVKRGDPLLFVVFRPDDAYVVDLVTHQDFNCDAVFRILALEWPAAKLAHQMTGISLPKGASTPPGYTEEERQILRNGAFNSTIVVNGILYMPAGGLTGAGTSTKASQFASAVLQRIGKTQKLMNDDREWAELMLQTGLTWPSDPDLDFVECGPKLLAFRENKEKIEIPISY